MATGSDQQAEQQIRELLAGAGIPVDVTVRDGVATLIGRVSSPRLRLAALDLASDVPDVRRLDDQIDYEVIAPDMATEPADDDMQFDYADRIAQGDDVDDVDPTFAESTDVGGSADPSRFQEAIEEGDVYFPPTDPVVEPSTDDQELTIVGGFSESSMEGVERPVDQAMDELPADASGDFLITRNDDDIAAQVRQELERDALTTDLDVEVTVVDGVVFLQGSVPTLDDAEHAESVASRVPGIREIRDLTDVEPR